MCASSVCLWYWYQRQFQMGINEVKLVNAHHVYRIINYIDTHYIGFVDYAT
jgi:hypothetical protein